MALQECTLHLNQRLKELNPHGSLAFPCAGYSSAYTDHEEMPYPGTGMRSWKSYTSQKGALS